MEILGPTLRLSLSGPFYILAFVFGSFDGQQATVSLVEKPLWGRGTFRYEFDFDPTVLLCWTPSITRVSVSFNPGGTAGPKLNN